MSLKASIARVFSANFISMISGVIIGFIVPAVLSVSAYANLKTYTFYITYIGVLHLGFVDGMYIKYGGKKIEDIDKSQFKLEHNVFIISQIIATMIFLIIALIKKDIILFLLAISIIPINTFSFHQLFYQAVGEFKKYTNTTYCYTVTYLILNLILVVIFKETNYLLYCFTTIIANFIVFIYLEIKYFKFFYNVKSKFDVKVFENIKVGFFVLLGNLSVVLFYGLDRWFIKIFYSINDFAYYSFALSILTIINLLVSSIAVILYNFLSQSEDEKLIIKLKNYLLILGMFASLGFFVFSGFVNIFLKKYIPSLDIISILFSAYPYMIVINVLFVNLYKVRKDEKKYLKVVIAMVAISFVYNYIAKTISDNSSSIALATTLAFITWYIYSSIDFKYLKPNIREVIFLLINILMFLITSHYLNWIIGGIIYLITILITVNLFYKYEFKEAIILVKNKISNK